MKQTHRPPRSIYPAQNRHMRRRTRVLAGLVAVLCFGGLLARLFTLQILDPSGYANRAAAQQLRDNLTNLRINGLQVLYNLLNKSSS